MLNSVLSEVRGHWNIRTKNSGSDRMIGISSNHSIQLTTPNSLVH